nr:lactoylglutathione lyase GLX1 [Tanacetum cinerariifolium]
MTDPSAEVYRVGDLQRSNTNLSQAFGMKLLRQRDVPKDKYSNSFLDSASKNLTSLLSLHTIMEGINMMWNHHKGASQPGPVKGGSSVPAFAKDPDGYLFELIIRHGTPEPLCQVMFHVGDLDRSIKFYEKALGMKLCRTIDRPEQKYITF